MRIFLTKLMQLESQISGKKDSVLENSLKQQLESINRSMPSISNPTGAPIISSSDASLDNTALTDLVERISLLREEVNKQNKDNQLKFSEIDYTLNKKGNQQALLVLESKKPPF
jgi:hypothetical protein